MKKLTTLFLLILTVSVVAQPIINIYNEDTPNGYSIYADNDAFYPVSVELNFKLSNLKSTKGNKELFVILAKSKKFKLTNLEVAKSSKGYKYSSKSKTFYGDYYLIDYDTGFEYYLPFAQGESFVVGQGYNGSKTHKNINALDFDMPTGTEIHSARGGIIVEVVEKFNRHCDKKECLKFNNYILIYHSDGTFASYAHIKKNGSAVSVGDEVQKGQLIGYSGNVGYSSGPHLHFEVFLPKLESREAIKTNFLTGDGESVEILKEKKEYLRNY